MPGLVLVLALGMVIGSDGLGLIDFGRTSRTTSSWRARSASSRWPSSSSRAACRRGFGEIRPVLGDVDRARHAGDARHGRADRRPGGAAARPRAARGAAARLDGGRHRRRRHLRRAARLDAAPQAGSHARGRVGHQRPDRDPARGRLHRGDPETRATGSRTRCCWSCASSSIGFVVGLAVAAVAVLFLRRVTLPSAGLYPVASVATAALAFGAALSLHGSGFLAVFLAGLVLGTASTPARRTIVTFHEGLAWVAQLGLFLVLGLLVFPSRAGGHHPRGRRDRLRDRRDRAAGGRGAVHAGGEVQPARAADARLGRPAGRHPDRVRDLPGDRAGARARACCTSTSRSSSCCSRPSSRARRSSPWRGCSA